MTEVDPRAHVDGGVGRMTQVMRGVSPLKATRALRIAVVQRGRVIEDAIFERGETITIGPTERSTFVVAEASLPPKFVLFEDTGAGFRLNVLDLMRGRLATAAGPVDIAGSKSIALGDDARGRVVVGETSFLFQMVASRPPKSKAPLPLSVRVGLTSEIDWTTVIVAAFSFLFHFGVIATLYGDWIDPLVDDRVEVGQLVEMMNHLPPPPVVERQIPNEAATAPVAMTTAKATDPVKSTSNGDSKAGGATGGSAASAKKGSGGAMSDARATEISRMLGASDVEMIGRLTDSGPSTAGVLAEHDIPIGLLDEVAANGKGVGAAAGLQLGDPAGGGPIRPGNGGDGHGLEHIGDTHGQAPSSAGTAIAMARPRGGQAQVGVEPHGGDILNPGATVASMGPGFRACYNKGITTEDPSMKGSLRLTLKIAPNGDVASLSTSGGSGLSSTVIDCVARRAQTAHFQVGEGGGGTVVVPVTFVQ
jgi:hypothetical protein